MRTNSPTCRSLGLMVWVVAILDICNHVRAWIHAFSAIALLLLSSAKVLSENKRASTSSSRSSPCSRRGCRFRTNWEGLIPTESLPKSFRALTVNVTASSVVASGCAAKPFHVRRSALLIVLQKTSMDPCCQGASAAETLTVVPWRPQHSPHSRLRNEAAAS